MSTFVWTVIVIPLVIAVVVGWYFWRRQQQPRVEVAERISQLPVTVQHEGEDIPDPHLIAITIRNRGRDDLVSQAFDRGKPITVRFEGSTLRAAVRTTPADLPVTAEGDTLSVGPALLKKGSAWYIDVLASHPTDMVWVNADNLARATCGLAEPRRAGVTMKEQVAIAFPGAAIAVLLQGGAAIRLNELNGYQWLGLALFIVGLPVLLTYFDSRLR